MRLWISLATTALTAAIPSSAFGAPPLIDAQARTYIAGVVTKTAGQQLPRLESRLCPAVLGLPAATNSAIENRMRAVARAAGLDVAAAPCQANVLLLVPKDRGELIRGLEKNRPQLFVSIPPRQIGALAASPEMAVAWQQVEQRGSDGRTLDGGTRDSEPAVQTAVTNSRLADAARPVLSGAVVVLDTKAALGLTITQIADYALMRAVTPSRETPADFTVPTVMSLFTAKQAGKPSPLSVTEWDLAYLKALYGVPAAFSGVDRSNLPRLMEAAAR